MAVTPVRTDIDSASLRLFDRALHPELFVPQDTVVYEFPGGLFQAAVTELGHVLFLKRGDQIVTEVVGVFDTDALPDFGIVAQCKATSGRDLHWSCEGLGYASSCHIDRVDDEVFERLDRELVLDSRKADLFCQLGGGNRLDPAAVSVVRIEPLDSAISIHAVHSYPSEQSFLRTQSLIDLR